MIKHPHRIFFIIAILFAMTALLFMPKWTVDDAFISYRYARNWVEAGELTWNVGDPPVEGYTGIFLPMLAAVLLSLGINVVAGIKVIGVIAFFLTGWLTRQCLYKLGARIWIQAIITLMVALSPFVYVHALSGLETMIYMALLMGILYLHLVLVRGKIGLLTAGSYALILLVASLTRPEGVLFALLSIIFLLLQHARAGNGKFGRLVTPILLLFVMPGIAYFIWRFQYYGYLLPNSFSAKRYAGLINPESVKAAGRFMVYFLAVPLGIAGLLALVGADKIKAAFQTGHMQVRWKIFRNISWLTGSFFVICLLVYFRSQLFMNYSGRFFAPFFPLLLVIAGGLLEMSWDAFAGSKERHPLRYRYTRMLIGVALLAQACIFAFKWKSELGFLSYYTAIVEQEYKPAAKFLQENLSSDATIITYMDAGAIPYYSGLRTIDFGRLNDLYLSRQRPNSEQLVDYFFAQNADAIIMTSESEENYFYIDEAIIILNDPRFVVFKVAEIFGNDIGYPYAQWIFVRK